MDFYIPKPVTPNTKQKDLYSEEDVKKNYKEGKEQFFDVRPAGFSMREWLFCHEVMRDGNVSDAARRVGFSESVASRASSLWLPANREDSTKPHIWDMVHEFMQERIKKAEIDADTILNEWKNIALLDPINVYDGKYRLRDLDTIPPEARRAMADMTVTENKDGDVIKKVKFHSKMEALNSLARYQNMFADDHKRQLELDVNVDFKNLPTGDLRVAFMAELKKLPEETRAQFTKLIPEGLQIADIIEEYEEDRP